MITFGCDVGPLAGDTPIERWDDVPAVSDDYAKARAAIEARLEQLFETLGR